MYTYQLVQWSLIHLHLNQNVTEIYKYKYIYNSKGNIEWNIGENNTRMESLKFSINKKLT